MQQLDLVIGVCTSAIHLSGALDVHTWFILGDKPDWRWMTEGDTTPSYPRMRLFRTQSDDSWAQRLQGVAFALKQETRGKARDQET